MLTAYIYVYVNLYAYCSNGHFSYDSRLSGRCVTIIINVAGSMKCILTILRKFERDIITLSLPSVLDETRHFYLLRICMVNFNLLDT